MLLNFIDNQLSIDGKPILKDPRFILNTETKRINLRTSLIMENVDDLIDLRIAWDRLNWSLVPSPQLTVDVICSDEPHRVYCEFTLSVKLLAKQKFRVKGDFNGREVDQVIEKFVEVFDLIKSML